ncbi:IS21-like element helper ATPase IstB [Pyxidicoccus caerfyrddinensis]|uniref:IS21-like element helper ATPase IstB n=1 Tax=Pyxidicoccus caerfyrddinensis TaxID=2709663 RepID=UPI0013DB7810|nr:IS21-like element helper ATPase IstB [Pyxidicoccus caerfyrddinensis]
MLVEQTLEKLNEMKLHGMAKAMKQWLEQPKGKDLTPEDVLGLLVDAEQMHRDNRKLQQRLKNAKLRQQACVEDIDYAHTRGLTKAVVMDLASSRWAQRHQNILLTGPTGVGKSCLACALGHKACRDGYSVVYRRASRLFDELAQARADGTYPHVLRRLAKAQVLILDDFGLEPLAATQRKELLEVLDDRYQLGSTIVASQLEPKDWHAIIGDATLADAILDRLVHNAHRLRLSGDSIRKADANLTKARRQVK